MVNAARRSGEPAEARPAFRHPDSWIDLDLTLADRRFSRPFRKTYDYPGTFIDDAHRRLGEGARDQMIDRGIDGWLLPDDALKLYELAYFGNGDILELGTFHGLSTSILVDAVAAAGRRNAIVTVDLSPELTAKARSNVARFPGSDRVEFLSMDATAAVERAHSQGRTFAFVFVDHSHRYEHVVPACRLLWSVVEPGGFVLFHDFNDPRNDDPKNDEYGVYQAVSESLSRKLFEFWGVYGCAGLFRRTQAQPSALERALIAPLRIVAARMRAVPEGAQGSWPYQALCRAVAVLNPGANGAEVQRLIDRARATALYQWARRIYHASRGR